MSLDDYDQRLVKIALQATKNLSATEIGDFIALLRIVYAMKTGKERHDREQER